MKKQYLIGLLVLLIAVSGLVLNCKKVADPQSASSPSLYGDYAPPFNPADFTDKPTCQAACNDYYNQLKLEELERHKQAMKACGKDRACKLAEITLHKENMAAIQAARLQCIHDCHDQGETGGGF